MPRKSPHKSIFVLLTLLLSVPTSSTALATGVPIGGFLPLVGIALTDEFDDDLNTFSVPSSQPSGTLLGAGGSPFYDIALLDTGAALSLITAQADTNFNISGPYPGESDGFRGASTITIGGATGFLQAEILDPVGLYAGGLQSRTGSGPLVMSHSGLEGQTNTSLISIPAESDLPNVLGLTFASQYAISIRSDLPQIFSHEGKTVRTPHIEFLPLGSGGQGITRRAPLTLNPGASFAQPPFWFFDPGNPDLLNNPHEDPSQPTVIQGATFLNVDVENEGEQLNSFEFFFDTGADVTVVSELNASRLGFDALLDEPDFTVAVVGSGGVNLEVPGFFVEEFTIQAIGGNVTATNVPVIVLNIPNPADPGNIVDGIVGTNLLAGRNVVIDPDPALGGGNSGPHLYISDPITSEIAWSSSSVSSSWTSGSNWSGAATPSNLGIANVRHVAGGNQTAVLSADATIWELNVSGTPSQTMTVQIDNGQTLTTFAGVNVEAGGGLKLVGSTLDTQYVEILGGTLSGSGHIMTGSGPIPGQVENRGGTVSPGSVSTGNGVGSLEITGRFSNGAGGTLAIELGGLVAETMFDVLVIDGPAALAGILDVSLVDLGSGLFDPQLGDTFEILTASEGVGGTFETLMLPAGYDWFVKYNPNSIELVATIPGDFDGDVDADADDFAIWQAGYGTGSYSGADFLTWQRNLSSGAPFAASSTVPEPGSLALLAAACGLALLTRKSTAPSVPL